MLAADHRSAPAPPRYRRKGVLVVRKAGAGVRRSALTVLELLVAISVVGLLAALLFPALNGAREATRRAQCLNHLKQIGLALHGYHDQHECLPPGWQWEVTGRSAYGWAVPLLPFLESRAVYQKVDRNRPLTDPANTVVRSLPIELFLCPSDIAEPTFCLFPETASTIPATASSPVSPLVDLPTANYLGVFGTFEADDETPSPPGDGTFVGARPIRFAEIRRGLSNTLAVGERTMARVPSTWLGVEILGEDAACRLVGNARTTPNCRTCDECEFASRHPGGANFLWADGHASLISETIPSADYQTLARRSE